MGILVRHKESGKIIFYLKGADTVIKQFLPESQRGFVDEESYDLATNGLRTLVISQKLVSEEFYEKWNMDYQKADQILEGRVEGVKKVIGQLEADMDFLGITGVEDKLQENVAQTLENMRNANIKVWMLTGDKIETAICIAISAGLKSPQQNMHIIKELTDELELMAKLNYFNNIA